MPTTVAQLRAFLTRFPDEATVQVTIAGRGGWEGPSPELAALDLSTTESGYSQGNWSYSESANELHLGET